MRQVLSNNVLIKKSGFTLIELIVAMTIFSIIFGVIVSIFVSGVQYFSNEKSQLLNQYSITDLSIALEVDTRKASSVSTSASCLVFATTSGNVSYCLDVTTHKVNRNGLMIADNIQSMQMTITLNKIVLTIVSVNDQRGINNTINLTYYLREGNY